MVSLLSVGLTLGYFCSLFCSLGTMYSFGSWMPALKEDLDAGAAEVAAITGLFQTGFYLGSIPARFLLHHCTHRDAYLLGGSLAAAVFFAVSFAESTWVLYFLFLAGSGMQCAFMAAATLIPRHLSAPDTVTATAWGALGSGLGTIVWASLSASLLPEMGWRASFRILAAMFLAIHAVGALGLQRPTQEAAGPPATKSPYATLLTNSNFVRFAAALGFAYFGYLLPFDIQGLAAAQKGISSVHVSIAYTSFGVSSMAGRLLVGVVGRWIHPLHLLTASFVGVTASSAILAAAANFETLVSSNVLLGITSGPMVTIIVPVLRELVPLSLIPDALALALLPQAVSGAAPILAGWIAERSGSYLLGSLVGLAALGVGIVLMAVVCWRHDASASSFHCDEGSTTDEGSVEASSSDEASDGRGS
ncbi:unnamed protein product [Polarella glacialis]|uniref:Major facilitator superfamily (MFS) profile domain-containing protein n=1 Tax=Polarella glacialis TaxID=89957 RepID=A0A813H212_POLGL|nr:unnamed protein product [Polarella glacialis]